MSEPGPPRELKVRATLDRMECVVRRRPPPLDWSGSGVGWLGLILFVASSVLFAKGDWGGGIALVAMGLALMGSLLGNLWSLFFDGRITTRVVVDPHTVSAGRRRARLADVSRVATQHGVLSLRGRYDELLFEIDASGMLPESRAWLVDRLKGAVAHRRDRERLPREARRAISDVERLRGAAREAD